jgi:hypothetical protein
MARAKRGGWGQFASRMEFLPKGVPESAALEPYLKRWRLLEPRAPPAAALEPSRAALCRHRAPRSSKTFGPCPFAAQRGRGDVGPLSVEELLGRAAHAQRPLRRHSALLCI